jgi:hypothetical protein
MNHTASRAKCPAAGPRVDRRVRPARGRQRARRTSAMRAWHGRGGAVGAGRVAAEPNAMPDRQYDAHPTTPASTTNQSEFIGRPEAAGSGGVREASPLGRAVLRPYAEAAMLGLTFEVKRDRRWGAWPAMPMMYYTAARAKCPAVGPRVDRGVRPRCSMPRGQEVGSVCAPWRPPATEAR